MVNAFDAARYLISLDPQLVYFNKNLITMNDRSFYEGNARLNKMLHLGQNMYIGKYRKKLIDADFYAYDNGGVIPDIQENYGMLLGTRDKVQIQLEADVKLFLHKVFLMLKDAPIAELIAIDHQDPAWIEKHGYHYKEEQIMDSMKYMDEYQGMYEAGNYYLDRMELSCA